MLGKYVKFLCGAKIWPFVLICQVNFAPTGGPRRTGIVGPAAVPRLANFGCVRVFQSACSSLQLTFGFQSHDEERALLPRSLAEFGRRRFPSRSRQKPPVLTEANPDRRADRVKDSGPIPVPKKIAERLLHPPQDRAG
jgi:hypothetical protein